MATSKTIIKEKSRTYFMDGSVRFGFHTTHVNKLGITDKAFQIFWSISSYLNIDRFNKFILHRSHAILDGQVSRMASGARELSVIPLNHN